MPYIGRDLNRGNYLKLDDISSSFNGSTQTFNLTVGGSAFTPGSAFSILVSVGGVIQEPESAYQVNNSEITFANAPTAQDGFFCIALAVPIGIGVPGNGTVNGTQMAKPFNYDGFFYLNDGTNRVGINSSSPTVALDVDGVIKASSFTGGSGGINAGVVTCTGLDLNGNGDVSGNFVIGGDLTVNGTTSTIDTNLIGVDRVEVGANSNTVTGIAVTQSGTADLVRLYDGASQVVTVDDEGNVGLGSAIPAELLDVKGNVKLHDNWGYGNHIKFHHSNNTLNFPSASLSNIARLPKISFGDRTSDSQLGVGDFRMYHDFYNMHMRYVGANGNLVIGNENTAIQINGSNGSGSVQQSILIESGAAAGVKLYQANELRFQTTSTGIQVGHDAAEINIRSATASATGEGHINFENVDGNGQPRDVVRIIGASHGNGGYGELKLQTAFNNSLIDRLVITQDGDVGIGSAIPSAKLDVAGIVKATDFKAPDGNTNGLYAGNSDDLHLFHNGADSYIENDTGNLTLTNKNNNSIIFKTTSSETEVVRITSAGDVGIGTAVPVVASNYGNLSLAGSSGGQLEFKRLSNDVRHYIWGNASLNIGGGYTNGSSSDIRFFVNGNNERLRITSDGEMLIGTGGADRRIAGQNFNSSNGWSGAVQIEKKNPNLGNSVIPMLAITAYNGADNQYTGGISFNRSNHNAQGTQGAVTTNQQLGNIAFNGSDGTNFIQGAEIFAIPDQTFATNDGPASLVFATTPDGTSEDEPQERLRINSSGHILPGASGTQNLGSTSKEWGDVYLADNKRLQLGSDQDMLVYHDNTHGYVSNRKNNLYVEAPNYVMITSTDTNGSNQQTSARFYRGGASDLYHSNTLKFSTSSTGITVDGEVAASQEYPVVKPTLDLNFAGTANLDPRVTFTRVGSASYYGRDGLLKFAAHNEPRFDHDPITRECKGLLIEEERQNWAYNSYRANNDYGGGGATYDDMGYNMINNAVTINDFGTAPDGTNTATKMYPASSGGARGIELQMSLNSTGNWTNSIYVKAAGHTGWIALYGVNGGARAYFNPSTGAKGSSSGTNAPSSGKYGIQDVGNGWYRIHITVNLTTTGGTEYHYIYFGDADGSTNVTASGTNGILMWGLQVEKGDFPTSYIRTDSRHRITRGADQCYIDGQDFLDFYNQTEGTMISSHSILSDEISSSHNLYTYQISPTGATAYAPLRLLDKNGSYGNSLTAASVYNNGTVFLVQDTGSPATVTGRKYKVAVSIKKDDYDAVFNGGDLKSDGSGDLYTADHMSIGYYKPSPQAYLNGHIQRLTYYPFKLTNNQLKTVTS